MLGESLAEAHVRGPRRPLVTPAKRERFEAILWGLRSGIGLAELAHPGDLDLRGGG